MPLNIKNGTPAGRALRGAVDVPARSCLATRSANFKGHYPICFALATGFDRFAPAHSTTPQTRKVEEKWERQGRSVLNHARRACGVRSLMEPSAAMAESSAPGMGAGLGGESPLGTLSEGTPHLGDKGVTREGRSGGSLW